MWLITKRTFHVKWFVGWRPANTAGSAVQPGCRVKIPVLAPSPARVRRYAPVRSNSDYMFADIGHRNFGNDHNREDRKQYHRHPVPLEQVQRGVERHADAAGAHQA